VENHDIGGEFLVRRTRLLCHFGQHELREHLAHHDRLDFELKRYLDLAGKVLSEVVNVLDKIGRPDLAKLSQEIGVYHDDWLSSDGCWSSLPDCLGRNRLHRFLDQRQYLFNNGRFLIQAQEM
jgi:hypothetical protein